MLVTAEIGTHRARSLAVIVALVAALGPVRADTGTLSSGSTFPQSPRARRWEQLWVKSGMDGLVSVRDLDGNGKRPVAVYVPPGFDPARPARVVTYFHGHDGDIGDQFHSNGVLARIKWLGTLNENALFIAPEAAAKPFRYWMTAPRESFTLLDRDALAEASRLVGQQITVGERIVSAHSGGGLALRNAVTSRQLRANRLEFLDSNYGDWGMVIATWAASQPEGNRPFIETWNTPGPTRLHDAQIKAAHPTLVTVNESPVGHFDIPGKLLGATLRD